MAVSGVEFKDNSKQVMREFEKGIAQALHRIGIKWLQNVKPLVPVDTSNLQKSTSYEVDVANKRVIVGIKEAGTFDTTDYAPYVELGTRYQTAQPYLRPSILNHINDYKSEVQKALGGGWSISVDLGGIRY